MKSWVLMDDVQKPGMRLWEKQVLTGGNCKSQGWEVGRNLVSLRCRRCWGGGREGDEVRKVMAQHARPGR